MAKMRKVDVIINQDRISDLPLNLIESILERISINEAARTSILSRKWRFIWTKIPKLMLNRKFLEGLSRNNRTESSRFVQVVDNILMLHNAPIQKFDITLTFGQTPNMDLWILYLSRNGVKELTLRNYYHHSYKLPSYIFYCDQLTHLNLHNCVLNTPLQCTSFCNLQELFLGFIFLSTNTGSLISMLLSLHKLFLMSCRGVENINNLPPNLSWFQIYGRHEFQWQWFQNKTTLSHLSFPRCKVVKNVDAQGKTFKLNSFLSNLPNLSSIVLDGFGLQFLTAGHFTEVHQLSHKLKQIKLCCIQFTDLDQVSSALCLLKSSPNLENLEIEATLDSNDGLEHHDLSYIANIADSDLKLNCLRSATLTFFTGLKAEFAFVKLILSHSPVLGQMKIVSDRGLDPDKECAISMELMKFHRASAESEIIIKRRKLPVQV